MLELERKSVKVAFTCCALTFTHFHIPVSLLALSFEQNTILSPQDMIYRRMEQNGTHF